MDIGILTLSEVCDSLSRAGHSACKCLLHSTLLLRQQGREILLYFVGGVLRLRIEKHACPGSVKSDVAADFPKMEKHQGMQQQKCLRQKRERESIVDRSLDEDMVNGAC